MIDGLNQMHREMAPPLTLNDHESLTQLTVSFCKQQRDSRSSPWSTQQKALRAEHWFNAAGAKLYQRVYHPSAVVVFFIQISLQPPICYSSASPWTNTVICSIFAEQSRTNLRWCFSSSNPSKINLYSSEHRGDKRRSQETTAACQPVHTPCVGLEQHGY